MNDLAHTTDAVHALQDNLLAMPQVDVAIEHLVHGGMYARTALIPANTVLTGAQTNADNICVVYGDITVTTDNGVQRLTGFNVLPASAGAKRAGFAHADTRWTMLARTDLQDVSDIEEALTGEVDLLQTRRPAIARDATQQLKGT
jgi:hypothetical protein